MYPDIPLLGITATNIRYLDEQRDMADELFDNHIASRMTQGEAIVRGILTPPKYVVSVFDCDDDLRRLEKRVKSTKSRASRLSAEEKLEALRRALEQATGLDEVFLKHMPDKNGKYLVFCSNAEHMNEMIRRVAAWFGKIDAAPHIYRAYSEDPATARAFADFKQDASEHLKLLFCIDMLNEGVHIDDVNGVILLRPTVSPIVYKQQIGRAFSASRQTYAVIFDVVLNIDNLCSIGAIREEMRAVIAYYKYTGETQNIVRESFDVTDETRDSRRLFEELEYALSASWEFMYAEAKKYYLANGNLLVPVKYRTETGLSLGGWLTTQRQIYAGKAAGQLSGEQIKKLEDIGIVWDNYHDLAWERSYAAARAYYEAHGDLIVPAGYVTEDGVSLGNWIAGMRAMRSNRRDSVLTEGRVARLDAIGMVWSNVLSEQWERNYLEAANYYRQHGDLLVPLRYVTGTGFKLGSWISHLRRARKQGRDLSESQIARLELIGMKWDAIEEAWNEGYGEALNYYAAHADMKVPVKYVSGSGYPLGAGSASSASATRRGRSRPSRSSASNPSASAGTPTRAAGRKCTTRPRRTMPRTATSGFRRTILLRAANRSGTGWCGKSASKTSLRASRSASSTRSI